MRKALKRITAVALAIMLIILSMIPSAVITSAAPLSLTLTLTRNTTGRYDLSFPASVMPTRTEISWHDPTSGALVTQEPVGNFDLGKMIFANLELAPDYIYDITVKTYNAENVQVGEGSTLYLADITFEGECFNIMGLNGDILDKAVGFEPGGATFGNYTKIRSGYNPQMRLRWKLPRIYHPDAGGNHVVYLTDLSDAQLDLLSELVQRVGFRVSMNIGRGSINTLDKEFFGLVPDGNGFVSVTLTASDGIQPGTEYERANVGLLFENAAHEQITLRSTKLRTDEENHFPVRNIDSVFMDHGGILTSIFTPIPFEITKVDVDKVEVRFQRITNGTYNELFYQVQYDSSIDDLYSTVNPWVKIPDAVLPQGELYGSEIVTITIPGTTHPEMYFRVVFYDSGSALPRSSSLCVDLRGLGTDSGKPPLPKEITVVPQYDRRKEVAVPSTQVPAPVVEIPMSDLVISFNKPLIWKMRPWSVIQGEPAADDDYAFHVLISTYPPDTNPNPNQTTTIGLKGTQTVYLPVKQKRVYVFGKDDLVENGDRLSIRLDGETLFKNYITDGDLTYDNDEDPSGDGVKGDYPEFLLPNTTYYMQVFTSRYRDLTDINNDIRDLGGLSDATRSKISYLSPVMSFTTWPLDELPVPMPVIELTSVLHSEGGNLVLDGIDVGYDRVLSEAEWRQYTDLSNTRSIRYDFYISTSPTPESFSATPVASRTVQYPAEAGELRLNQLIDKVIKPDGSEDAIKPNTVYYVKAQATLIVEPSGDDPFEMGSVFTPVKAYTTPRIDSGGFDIDQKPRTPTEFGLATDEEGNPRVSDAFVDLTWLHKEPGVTYELICTSIGDIPVDPAELETFLQNDTINQAFVNNGSETKRHIANPNALADVNGSIIYQVTGDFLRPNQIYYFSIRAVRNRGQANQTESLWVTQPVTTPMVKSPAYLEAVRDVEIGFNVICTIAGTTADSMEVFMKKAGTADSAYVKLLRSQYTVVKDGNTFYFRIYNLEPNQWYDFKLYNKTGNVYYNRSSASWQATPGQPVERKTRDTLHEIEVRWEGEGRVDEFYAYLLEVREEDDADYEKLSYSSTGFTDYGYDLPTGGRIKFYIEKTSLQVGQGSNKYIYYAKISGKPVKQANGTWKDMELKTNAHYFIKLWARNDGEDSLHIGPVDIRTDFSQKDYDDQQKHDNVTEVFNLEAEKLTKKLYWVIDKGRSYAVRVLLKADMVAGLLSSSGGSVITVDLTGEANDPSYVEVLVPQKVLEAIEANDAHLNLAFSGAEVTLNRGSIDLAALKQQALSAGAKEAMLKLKVERNTGAKTALPSGIAALSRYHVLTAMAVGSRYTSTELNTMIYKILKDKTATGPFKYGLLDRELTKVLQQIDSYSYRTQTELKDMITTVIGIVEAEMSVYLKDILEGGSGLSPALTVNKPITSFPGKVGIKLAYQYRNGLIVPFVNYGTGWKEVSGAKAYAVQYALFRVEKPGEYAVVASGTVTVSPGSPYEGTIGKIASLYDLTKVFGKTTILPSNPITGQQAVMVYALVSDRIDELTGLTPAQGITKLGVGDVVSASKLSGYMDNQTSVSLAVRLYADKLGISAATMKPAKTIVIKNASAINSRLYQYVILGIDLGFAKTSNYLFDAGGRSTTGQYLDMIAKVLEKIGQ